MRAWCGCVTFNGVKRALLQTSCLLVAVVGCATSAAAPTDASSPDSVSSDATDSAPQVIVGGANSDGSGFVDWSGGAARPAIITGIQGGQHVYVSVRTRNLNPQQVKITALVATPADCTP